MSVIVIVVVGLAAVLFFKLRQLKSAANQKQGRDFTELKTPKQPATSAVVEDRSVEHDAVGFAEGEGYERISRDSKNQEHVYDNPGI